MWITKGVREYKFANCDGIFTNVFYPLQWTFPVITSQLHGSEAEGPKQTRIGIRFGPLASLPCSCDVIAGKVYSSECETLQTHITH